MILSHDRKTLFIGVPKNGSQTARAVLSQFGVDLVGEMGRHPTVPEAIKLAQARFPGEVINPTEIYAFWRDPVERFCSAVEFHKRCLPNSFIQLFPGRFAGLEPHPRWFEPDAEVVAPELRKAIANISPVEIVVALPPPAFLGIQFQPRGGNLSFYRPQGNWLTNTAVKLLPFADFDASLSGIINQCGGDGGPLPIPRLNAASDSLHQLSLAEHELVRSYYQGDLRL